MKNSIPTPSEDQVKEDHRRLYRGLHMQSVAVEAGTSAERYSKQRSVEAELTRNPIWEVMMEMRASKITCQESIGKGVFQMLYDYAVLLGLVDAEPLDILKLARDRIRSIKEEDVAAMNVDALTFSVVYASEIEKVVNDIKSDLIAKRQLKTVEPGFEFSSSGLKSA